MGPLFFLDGVNLAFHESGHIIFGILRIQFLTILGGTFMQLTIPLAIFIHLKVQEKPLSIAVVLFWFRENFLHIRKYMKDAIVQELPLVGDGTHDWTYLFGDLGVIHHCVGIGQSVIVLGLAIMSTSVCWFCTTAIKKWFSGK